MVRCERPLQQRPAMGLRKPQPMTNHVRVGGLHLREDHGILDRRIERVQYRKRRAFGSLVLRPYEHVGVNRDAVGGKPEGADAAAVGASVAVGAAISIGVVKVDTNAQLDRAVLSAADVKIFASGINSVEVTAHAGANGAKADDGTEGQAEGESSEDDSEASKSIDKVLASGNKLAGNNEEICPSKNAQKPTTSEGTVSVGAALGLLIANGTTGATLNQSLNASGNVTILSESEKDLILNSDASATNSDTGVGVAVGGTVASIALVGVASGASFCCSSPQPASISTVASKNIYFIFFMIIPSSYYSSGPK